MAILPNGNYQEIYNQFPTAEIGPDDIVLVKKKSTGQVHGILGKDMFPDSSTTDFTWKPLSQGGSYSIDEAVIYNGVWWLSLVDNNEDNIPTEGQYWTQINRVKSPVIKPWVAGVYDTHYARVLDNDIEYFLRDTVTLPFNSETTPSLDLTNWKPSLLNENDFVSNSQTQGATQASIKAFVEAITGLLANLTTIDKSTLVAAINELREKFKPYNYTAIANPGATNDLNDGGASNGVGYEVGSKWLNTTTGEWFMCTDPADGAAVWEKLSLTQDELAAVALTGAYGDLTGLPDLSKYLDKTTGGTVTGTVSLSKSAVDGEFLRFSGLAREWAFYHRNINNSTVLSFEALYPAGPNRFRIWDKTSGMGFEVVPTSADRYISFREDSVGEYGRLTWNSDGSIIASGDLGGNSDKRLKKNVRSIRGALEKLMQLQGRYFTWKRSGKKSIGWISQEIGKVFPELVNIPDDPKEMQSVFSANITAVLAEAQKEAVQEYRSEIIALKNQNVELIKRIEKLERLVK